MNKRTCSATFLATVLFGLGPGLSLLGQQDDPAAAKREARLADPDYGQMRRTTQAQRDKARLNQAAPKAGVSQSFVGLNPANSKMSPLAPGRTKLATMAAPLSMPDYFGIANWANSPLPVNGAGQGASVTAIVTGGVITGFTITNPGTGYTLPSVSITDSTGSGAYATAVADPTTGAITAVILGSMGGGANYSATPTVTITGINPNSGMHKFVDMLPGLCGISPWGTGGANGLGQCIPVATKFATPPAGVPADGDYYEIGLQDYSRKLHTDLPATKLRGYTDLNPASTSFGTNQYLGPLILAKKGVPVRVKFTNKLGLGSAGNLFIPTDTTYMGAGMGPGGQPYAQNRATLHLHGGNTPWISDGTPHQWTVPLTATAGNNSSPFLKGFSARDVPDMPATATGELTFLWTNQQGGRLMFYHDHAYGITRLNVYAGEAAGYLLADPVEEDGLYNATVPGTIGSLVSGATPADTAHLIPLVIQDKTFVPDDGLPGGQLAATDPTWDVSNFGGKGSLWFPHVYMPNQNPFDLTGANPFGRWDYGPWFWPPQNPGTFVPAGQPQPCSSIAYPGAFLTCPGTPNPSGTPEGFMDTMVVNGTAYPTLPVEPAAYRFQILSAGNDRTLNLGLYYAVDSVTGVPCKGGNVFTPANCTEVGMVPAVPHTAATVPPLCSTPTATSGAMLALADMTGGVPANGTGLPPACWPTSWPTDGRDGGVPDPATAGPPIIQIGTEGGLLPAPVAIPSTPMGYEYNRRSITVLNVFTHGLTLGPAERADVIVDFSGVPASSVLILYNDGPAPVPAFDPRSDYYTGSPDQTSTGGAPSTQAGFGPNTRTVMQIKVSGSSTNAFPFSFTSLSTALPGLFVSLQDQIIVPETAYPTGNGASLQNNYARISDTSLAIWNGAGVGSLNLLRGGSYTSVPNVTIAAPPVGTQATASATLATAGVGAVIPLAFGFGYTAAPGVSFTGGGGTSASAQAVLGNNGVRSISITNGGANYSAAPSVIIAAPTCVPAPGTCVQATATATISSNKKVNSISVTNPGAGYTAPPAVSFSVLAGNPGTGAAATANLGSRVIGYTVSVAGSGYSTAPTVTVAAPPSGNCVPASQCVRATATANLLPRPIASLTLLTAGTGYFTTPTVSISCPGTTACGSGGAAVAVAPAVPLLAKAIQELFTLDYGRMNATLGTELPFTNFTTQTTIPYGYVDPPTEIFGDGETQYWKITHNGVDTHFIHFHLFNVQVINRVGWDGAVKPPDANELSWKDTVRMNPLEDIVVALRPLKQTLPATFPAGGLPNSVRPLDVTEIVGSSLPNQFANIDPANQPATVVNDMTNFGYEYVWHCHILGHEENDMMRAMVFGVPPIAPSNLVSLAGGILGWTDNSNNETGFTIQSAASSAGPWTTVGTVPANTTQWKGAKAGTWYQVIANNVVGYTRAYAAPIVGWNHPDYPSAPSGPHQY